MITVFKLHWKTDDTFEILEQKHDVDLSFDNILLLLEMLNDDELDDASKIELGIEFLLGKPLGLDIEDQHQVFNELFERFIQAEKQVRTDRLGNPLPVQDESKPNYCFSHDAEYIYASFMQAYGIDLIEEQGKLHWVKFKALLDGLPDDTKFRQVVDIRMRKLPTGKGTADERKSLMALKKIYALPGQEVDEE